ncbi:MAG: DNA primase [Desulfatibacillaceae bacterium]
MFNDDQVNQVRHAVNIVDVVGDYVALRPAGQNHWGLCPFHSEKTPSFSVHEQKQIFHCFGCGAGGNVFTFVMRINNMTFPEALAQLAGRCGIQLETGAPSPERKRKAAEREQTLAINELAAEFFRKCLKDTREGKTARDYLENRGMAPSVVNEFLMGYAPNSWEAVGNHLEKHGYTTEQVHRAGLLAEKNGRYYTRFRDRVMLPIQDIQGRIIGFGGRLLASGDVKGAKYLNTSQSPVYDKSRVLYGLNLAREHCRKEGVAYVVEGYFDMISLYAAGVRNCVATCGTALTKEHVRTLKGFARDVVLVFDGDSAGVSAARRSLSHFLEEKVSVRVLVPPDGYDPDDFVQRHGGEAFLQLDERESRDLVNFLLDAAVEEHGKSVEGTLRVVDDMARQLSGVEDGLTRSLYARTIADRLGIGQNEVMSRFAPTRPEPGEKKEPWRGRPKPRAVPPPALERSTRRLERQILTLAVYSTEVARAVAERGLAGRFRDPALKRLCGRAVEKTGDQPVAGDIMCLAETEEDRELLASLTTETSAMCLECGPPDPEMCDMILERFEYSVQNTGDDLNRRILEAEAAGDTGLVAELLAEKQRRARAALQGAAPEPGTDSGDEVPF